MQDINLNFACSNFDQNNNAFSGSSKTCLIFAQQNFTDEGLSQNNFWTSGELSWNSTPCIGDLTINWCSGQQNMSTLWWKSKFPSLSIADAGKQIALKVILPPETSALSLSQHTAELPFLCKVFNCSFKLK
jgi:hypothetical protein